ncbi:MAG: TonB C-terminal domain-containing protein [Desulfuromonadaceae bacterium]|nr:TonB C-terminal domain-containing protein [Desulfuromonadaceae bacterium]
MPVKTQNNFRRSGISHSRNSGFGRMLLVSLGLHLLVFLVFGNNSFFPRVAPLQNIYHVDLLTLPAPKPPGPVVSKAEPPQAAPAVVEPTPQKVPPKPVVEPLPLPPPPAKPVARKVPVKPAPPAVTLPTTPPRPSERDLSAVAKRIEALQQQQAQDDIAVIRDKLAQLKAGLDAPVATPESGGQDGGAELVAKVRAYLTENWTFSPYQLKGNESDANFLVKYNAAGELINFNLVASSGSAIFDQSAKSAILKSKKLPFPLEGPQEFDVFFEVETIKKRR